MAVLKLDEAEYFDDPFPHAVLDQALPPDTFEATSRAIPAPEGFATKGRGLKLELDVTDSSPQLAALTPAARAALLALRQRMRETAPFLAARFEVTLRQKYRWLLGDVLADEALAAGWTTTNGRVMGRAPGYLLRPHLDSSHLGITCLLYFSDAATPDQGALGLYRPEWEPKVLKPSTYYPEKEEGIRATLVKSIAVKSNRFVAFTDTPVSLHGFHRTADASGWRFAYQCHVVPKGLQMDDLIPRLDDSRRRRWETPHTTAVQA